MKLLAYPIFAFGITTAYAAPYDCGQSNPHIVRSIFESSPYAKGENPKHKALTTELPVIKKNNDGTCSAIFHVRELKTSKSAGEISLQLVVMYFACNRPYQLLTADQPNSCPWLNLRAYPVTQ